MALSDQLTKLAARAKEAEDRAAAAKTKARAELEQDVQSAREAAQAQADQMREAVEADQSRVSEWWTGSRRTGTTTSPRSVATSTRREPRTI
jgi:cell division septum initiation protein DivIVA